VKRSYLSAVVVLAAIANPLPAVSAAYLCIEDALTGFDWKGGHWVQTNFITSQYLIRKHDPDDPIAATCYAELARDGREIARINEKQTHTFGCYSHTEVGAEPSYPSACREWLDQNGGIALIQCSSVALQYQFMPTGEYFSTRDFGAVGTFSAEDERDSLGIAVGRCSVVSD
jgi:hypothetical protein